MINTAEEFVKLRESNIEKEYNRAARESASIDVWLDVIKRYPYMREWVAYNKSVQNEVLQILVNDKDPKVRWMVATRRTAGEKILFKLADDEDEGVRRRVIFNPKVSKSILEKLINDPLEDLRILAKEKLKKLN